MRKLTFHFVLAILSSVVSLFANGKDAQHYLNIPEKYLGRTIVLNATSVRRVEWRNADALDGVFYQAYTTNINQNATSFITVLVPKDKTENFARRFGSDSKYMNGRYKTSQLVGKLRKSPSDIFLDYYLEWGK
jgi:hypothetical protein